jgi:hypothetical protein
MKGKNKQRLLEIRRLREISFQSECVLSTSGTQAKREVEKLLGRCPYGKEFCHHCDNSLCYNPSHIFIGTHSENMSDCADKGRLPIAGWNRGIPQSEETKKKMSRSSLIVCNTEKYKRKMSLAVADLTYDQIVAIRKDTQKSIYDWAKELGIRHEVVYRIKVYHTFKWIKGEPNEI